MASSSHTQRYSTDLLEVGLLAQVHTSGRIGSMCGEGGAKEGILRTSNRKTSKNRKHQEIQREKSANMTIAESL